MKDIKGNETEVISFLIPHSDHLSGKVKKVKKNSKNVYYFKRFIKTYHFRQSLQENNAITPRKNNN